MHAEQRRVEARTKTSSPTLLAMRTLLGPRVRVFAISIDSRGENRVFLWRKLAVSARTDCSVPYRGPPSPAAVSHSMCDPAPTMNTRIDALGLLRIKTMVLATTACPLRRFPPDRWKNQSANGKHWRMSYIYNGNPARWCFCSSLETRFCANSISSFQPPQPAREGSPTGGLGARARHTPGHYGPS